MSLETRTLAAVVPRPVLKVIGVTEDRTVGADSVLELQVMVAAGVEDSVESWRPNHSSRISTSRDDRSKLCIVARWRSSRRLG